MARAMAQFDSEGQARDAYFSVDNGGGFTPESGVGWADPEDIDTLEGNWIILRQEQLDGDASRYFLLVGPDPDVTLAMRRGGGTVEVSPEDTFDDLPSIATEDEARAAHALWLDEWEGDGRTPPERNEETTDADGNRWSAWDIIEEVPPWFVFARTREDDEAAEYLIAGQHADGHEVYLHPRGRIETEPYIYTSIDTVEDALQAYFDADERGNVAESDRPTGDAPNADNIGRAAGLPGGGEGTPDNRSGSAQRILGTIVRFVGRNPRVILVVLVIAVLVHRRYAPGGNPLDNAKNRIRGDIGGIDGTN